MTSGTARRRSRVFRRVDARVHKYGGQTRLTQNRESFFPGAVANVFAPASLCNAIGVRARAREYLRNTRYKRAVPRAEIKYHRDVGESAPGVPKRRMSFTVHL